MPYESTYEQEQTRAEREAVAEIERVRNSAPTTPPTAGGIYTAFVFALTAATAVFAAAAIPHDDTQFFQKIAPLWPYGFLVALAFTLPPLLGYAVKYVKSMRNLGGRYGYECAFRLDMVIDVGKVNAHLRAAGHQRSQLAEQDRACAKEYRSLGTLSLHRGGGARVEYVSADTTMIKVHSVVRLGRRRPWYWFRRVDRTLRAEQIGEQTWGQHRSALQPKRSPVDQAADQALCTTLRPVDHFARTEVFTLGPRCGPPQWTHSKWSSEGGRRCRPAVGEAGREPLRRGTPGDMDSGRQISHTNDRPLATRLGRVTDLQFDPNTATAAVKG